MTIETIIGFDSAWTDKSPGAICIASFDQRTLTAFQPPRLVHFNEAAKIVENEASLSNYTLLALDQPTLVPNLDSLRPVERIAGSIVNAIHGGVQPANRSRTTMFGDDAPIWRFLDSIKARENPFAAREAKSGLFLIEVFPALSLPSIISSIWERRRAAKYNPANSNFSLDDWNLVTIGLAEYAGKLLMLPLATAAYELSLLESPKKADQDKLDALICLAIAVTWRYGPRRDSMVLGDNTFGYMVTLSSEKIRTVLTKAAMRKNVPVESAWANDAKRSLDPTGITPMFRSYPANEAIRHNNEFIESRIGSGDRKICPECGKILNGKGWTGIDAHWKRFHEDVMPYNSAWPVIRSGKKPSLHK